MVKTAILLLAVVAVASSASIGQQASCCGPAEWEAMAVASAAYGYSSASSKSMSGSMMVDHDHKVAALYLMSMAADSNTTMTVTANDSSVFVYFILQRFHQANQQPDPQPSCAAFVLKNVISDLSSSCFPTGQGSPVDRLMARFGQSTESIPVNMLAYEYAGLDGLIAVQMLANAQDCTPMLFGVSTADDQGPQLSVTLSNINSGTSDKSMLGMPPAACSQTTPMEIKLPNGGMFGSRRGMSSPMGRNGPTSRIDSRRRQQWIDNMVMMYIIKMMRPHPTPMSSRSRRDLQDLLGIHHKDSQPTTAEILQSALAMKQMMQALSDFIGPVDDSHDSRDPADQTDIIDVISMMVKQNLISSLTSDNHRDDGRDDSHDSRRDDNNHDDSRRPSDQMDISDVISMMVKQNLISSLTSDNHRDDGRDDSHDSRRDDNNHDDSRRPSDQSDLESLISLMIQKNLLSGIRKPSPQDVLTQLVKVQGANNLAYKLGHLLELEIENSQDSRGPDRSQLMKLMKMAAIAAAVDQASSPDYQNLLKLMLLKQQQPKH